MKKFYLFAIAALGVFALASCQKEAEAPAADGKAIQVTVVPEVEKAYLNDDAGFWFAANDNLYWVSEDGNASQTIEEETKTPTVTMTIPGLAVDDVTGYFATFDGEIDFTEQEVTPACGDIFVAGKQITIPAATENIEVAVGIVGSVFRFFPYGADFTAETIKSVSVVSENAFAGTATYNAEDGTVSCTPTATAVIAAVPAADQINVESAKGASYIVKVPEGTITAPVFKVRTDAAEYTFTCTADKVCKAGYVYDIPLNLAKATSRVVTLVLNEGMISTNAPMQYVNETITADVLNDTYGMGDADWVKGISNEIKEKRRLEVGTASNLWDDDDNTSFNTNQDIWNTGDGWTTRSGVPVANHYIQVDLGSKYDNITVYFKNAKYRPNSGTAKVSISADGVSFSELPNSPYDFDGAGAELSIKNLVGVRAFRISPSAAADWTQNGPSFGLSEVKVWAQTGTEKVSVTGVELDQNSVSLAVGATKTLTATVSPDNASDKSVTWTSEDEGVATVVDGVVTGVSEGSTTIKVKTNDGSFEASCSVTVTAEPVVKVFVFGENQKASFDSNGSQFQMKPHDYSESGEWGGYVEIQQEGTSYYTTSATVKTCYDINDGFFGIEIVKAGTYGTWGAHSIPASDATEMFYYCWVNGGMGETNFNKGFASETAITLLTGADYSPRSSTLTSGEFYFLILYYSGEKLMMQLIPVTTTKPE